MAVTYWEIRAGGYERVVFKSKRDDPVRSAISRDERIGDYRGRSRRTL